MQKYNFSNPKSVVEVRDLSGTESGSNPHGKPFSCLCRGFGQNKHAPRKSYVIVAHTPAQAARIAMEKYRKDYGNE